MMKDPGPPRPGTFAGEHGWNQLNPAPKPLREGTLFTSELYDVTYFDRCKNHFNSDFSVRLYSGNQEVEFLGVKFLMMLKKLEIITIAEGGLFNTYPQELHGETVLIVDSDITYIQDEIFQQAYGSFEQPKTVFTLKIYDVPPGMYVMQTLTGNYFVEIGPGSGDIPAFPEVDIPEPPDDAALEFTAQDDEVDEPPAEDPAPPEHARDARLDIEPLGLPEPPDDPVLTDDERAGITRRTTSFAYPVAPYDGGRLLNRTFGVREGTWPDGSPEYHIGEDIALEPGTPIRSIADGNVVLSLTESQGYEQVVVLEHVLTDGTVILSIYGHLSEREGYKQAGMRAPGTMTHITKGQIIGYVGWDDENGEGGPHLHMGLRIIGKARNYTKGTWYRGHGYSTDMAEITSDGHLREFGAGPGTDADAEPDDSALLPRYVSLQQFMQFGYNDLVKRDSTPMHGNWE